MGSTMEQDRWNLKDLYQSDESWNHDFDKLDENAAVLATYRGSVGNAASLLKYLRLRDETWAMIDKLLLYAELSGDEDISSSKRASMRGTAENKAAAVKASQAFFVPELLDLPDGRIDQMYGEEPELELYRTFLGEIMLDKPHTLDSGCEALLSGVSECLAAPERACHVLKNADMSFDPIIGEDGSETAVSESSYFSLSSSADRRVRKDAFSSLFSGYRRYSNTIFNLLISSVRAHAFQADAKKYDSVLQSCLRVNNIPESVYRTCVGSVNSHTDMLHRYIGLKKKILGLDEMHLYDLKAPLDFGTGSGKYIEFQDGLDMIKEALAPLGSDYTDALQMMSDKRHIDRYPRDGKASGAYSTKNCNTMPYILTSYNGRHYDVLTLAHELGHSLHSWYSFSNQPYIYSDYSGFCAEIASTTNEVIMGKYLIDKSDNISDKLRIIDLEISEIMSSVYRQVFFSEFELFLHGEVENGRTPTIEDLCDLWHSLNEKYYGPDIVSDRENDYEWARIPYFFWDYYVYTYATGYVAASSFAKMVLDGGAPAAERYKGFLKSGSCDTPINILKKAGVDMTSEKPYDDMYALLEELTDSLEKGFSELNSGADNKNNKKRN